MRVLSPAAAGRPLLLLALAALCLLSLFGAAQRNRNTKNDSDYSALTQAPEQVRKRQNPLQGDRVACVAGKKLFLQHCAECHGTDADGGKKAPSLRVDEVQQATPGTLFWVLTNGVVRRGMPVWSKLPEPQRWQIVAYIESLRTTPKATQP